MTSRIETDEDRLMRRECADNNEYKRRVWASNPRYRAYREYLSWKYLDDLERRGALLGLTMTKYNKWNLASFRRRGVETRWYKVLAELEAEEALKDNTPDIGVHAG